MLVMRTLFGALKDEGDFAWIAAMVEAEDGKGEWLHWEFDGKVVARYPMGYPLPYLPTGLRHAAFQLTDKLIEAAEPVALLLASCVTHGQSQPREFLQTMPAEFSGLPYWKVFRNHSSHSESFFRNLTFGRVFVHEYFRAPGVAIAMLLRDDGEIFLCNSPYGTGATRLNGTKLSFETRSPGATWTQTDKLGDVIRTLVFYDPDSGGFHTESLRKHPDPHKRLRGVIRSGWVQDSWPRAMADKCPKLELPANMRVNEKQTSRKMKELRRQDPAAPIRDFPGSHLTAPGRTGLASSDGRPTTTKGEVDSFLEAQEGTLGEVELSAVLRMECHHQCACRPTYRDRSSNHIDTFTEMASFTD